MPSSQTTLIRKRLKSNLRDGVDTVENLDTKQLIALIRKAIRIWDQKEQSEHTKETEY